MTNLWVAHAMHDFQEQCQTATVFHAVLCVPLFSSKQLCNKTGSNKIQFFVISADNQGLQ